MNNINWDDSIEITGAREHNLKNISLSIPRNKLVVLTGLSGSGKSSLAFDTIYAEGQRRYIESFSSYARQFLGGLERPDVDQITGLSPVIAIEQKTTNKNPRSTVGTVTEIYDFMRLLFARAGKAYSYLSGLEMVRYSEEQIISLITEHFTGKKVNILSPLVKGRKGHYRELFEQAIKQGYLRARIDGKITELKARMQLDRYKVHNIELVIDRFSINEENAQRLKESIKTALKMGKGTMAVNEFDSDEIRFYSKSLMCPETGLSYDDPAPNLFSFNSPFGACTHCNGLGVVSEVDINKLIPNPNLSIKAGAILALNEIKSTPLLSQLESLAERFGFNLNTPVSEIPEDGLSAILYGSNEIIRKKGKDNQNQYSNSFEGIVNYIARQKEEWNSKTIDRWAESFMNKTDCPKCNGARLKKEALHYRIADKNIHELSSMNIGQLREWFAGVEKKLDSRQRKIAKEVIKEIQNRLDFLLEVGLYYLELRRPSQTLSGGESQRIRLATQLGSQLVGVLYILDEPSIGLHQRDNIKLIKALHQLRDSGNSVLVVEHDKEMMELADYIIDIGHGAGVHGGHIVAQGDYPSFIKQSSLTSDYLSNKRKIIIPDTIRSGNGKYIELKGASGHNLKNVNLKIPLGKLICVTGVSGSGKSSLINQTLFPIINKHFYSNFVQKPLGFKSINGLEHIDKIIEIDQLPIGRTPRSNPVTYTNVFTDIRTLFSELPESKIRGYKPGRFSFNVKGGKCEKCSGGGMLAIEMNFLPDVYVVCDDCNGKRYNRETLEIRYKGKSISDVLNMTIDDAITFFENIPSITNRLKTIHDVGLGYITLGQSSTTLSGGEAQRIKLASELAKKDTGNTLYILDEPSTGLHFEDIRILMDVIHRLVDNGNTVIIIEHNLDIIKVADYIIDIGPEGGEAGGKIIFEGTVKEIIKSKESLTGIYLRKELENYQ
jgi:excinuclease ABC subunit A